MRDARRATILVADDDDGVRSAVRQVLVAEGYDVVEAADGARILELLARAEDEGGPLPDLLLLDFVMPGYSGLGILRALRRFARRPPTIVMTAFPDPRVEELAGGLGAHAVLRKPVLVEALVDAVRGALASGAAGA